MGRPEPFSTAPLPILNPAPPIPMPFPLPQLWCALCMTSDAAPPHICLSHLPHFSGRWPLASWGAPHPPPTHTHIFTLPHTHLSYSSCSSGRWPLGHLGRNFPAVTPDTITPVSGKRGGGVGHVEGQRDGRLSNDPIPSPDPYPTESPRKLT